MLYRWIKQSNHGDWTAGPTQWGKRPSYTPSSKEFDTLEDENVKLKRLLGEKDLEIAILRDLEYSGAK